MKITTILYKCFALFWKINPCKRMTAHIIRATRIPLGLIYRDLRFSGPFRIRLGKGKSIKLYHHFYTSIENVLFWKGLKGFENYSLLIWSKLSRMTDTIYDIGANTGLYSLVSACENPHAKIYAFEPSERTVAKLQKNIDLNGFNNIQVSKIALSDHDGEAVYYEPVTAHQYSASLNYFMRKMRGGEWTEHSIETMTLDSVIAKEKASPGLLKIDVELHEPEVIRGFQQGIKTGRPSILIEILTQEVADQLNELFKDSGYTFNMIDEINHKLSRVDSIREHDQCNYLICTEEVLRALDL